MNDDRVYNLNISSKKSLITPAELFESLPATEKSIQTVDNSRTAIRNILDKKDLRKIIVVGPCSIHDTELAIDYANRLKKLSEQVQDKFLIIMRVYFEKPRTTVGWKGFINDPHLDDSFEMEEGIRRGRELLIQINEMGLPIATEALDPIMPQFHSDQITWYAIGARTAESQTHREMASGLSAPVGIKNGTEGGLDVAINGMKSILESHNFLGIDQDGQCTIFTTSGNNYAHIVLRGGKMPNYDSVSVAKVESELRANDLLSNIMIDCSHGNSSKDHNLQPLVFDNCIHQILEGNQSIIGMMLESNIHAGQQKLGDNPNDLEYGVSITDACIDWETTQKIIIKAREQL